jgi:hypothetical protein
MCSVYWRRPWYRASRSSVNTLSTCHTRKLRYVACTSQNVLSCALYTAVEPFTRHRLVKWTHCLPTLQERVGLLLALREGLSCAPRTGAEPGTGHLVCQWTHCPTALLCKHRSTARNDRDELLQGILFVRGHSVHLPYHRAYVCYLHFPGLAVLCSRYRSRTWYRASRSLVATLST